MGIGSVILESKYNLDVCTGRSDYSSSPSCLSPQNHDKEITKLRIEFEEKVRGTVLIAHVSDT